MRAARLAAAAAALVAAAPGATARAQTGGVAGTTAWSGGYSSRWLAMGRAGAADPDNAGLLSANPALLAGAGSKVALHTFVLPAGFAEGRVRYAHRLARGRAVAAEAARLSSADSVLRDAAGAEAGSARASVLDVSLGGGVRVGRRLSVGAAARTAQTDLAGFATRGYAVDVGALFVAAPGLSVGGTVQRLVAVPVAGGPHVRAAAAASLLSGRLTFAADLDALALAGGRGARWHAGAQFHLADSVALRIGAETVGACAGFGIGFGRLTMDYAAVATASGLQHAAGISAAFP